MKRAAWAIAALTVAACSQPPAEKTKSAEAPAAPAAAPAKNTAPAGEYKLDKTHASVTFRVNHLGMSRYTARFTGIDGVLQFDPANPAAMSIMASVDPKSIETDFPLEEPDFDEELAGPQWLDAAKFPLITFKSTKVEPTGANTAKVTGDFTLHGVTRPLVLDATFNGGYAAGGMDPMGARIGFSAQGKIKRSDFGVSYGVPSPGSTFGVGDEVEILIEAEFTQPAPAGAAKPPA
jgi:polyisoprenoid-binding protein YceI